MKITIIGGTGYVGLCSGVGLAIKGHDVICVGINKSKVDSINRGIPPIYEDNLEDYLKKSLQEGKISATLDIKAAIKSSDISFICVGTPSREDGSIDLGYIEKASESIGEALKDSEYHVVVMKSTVVPGTTENVINILERVSGKVAGKDFGVCMNPEFLREGLALKDFLEPDRIVIGEYDKKSGDTLEGVYNGFNAPVLRTSLKTAEMIKYTSNAFLATKISFTNEIANICKQLNIDVYDVMKGVGMDHRISPSFLNAGTGWGGSCFPKDVSALIALARGINYKPEILDAVTEVNNKQKIKMVEQVEKKLGNLEGKRIALLGLAFKSDTDDIREAPAIDIIKKLKDRGAVISAYDPKAIDNMKGIFPDVDYFENPQDTLKDADACLIVTEWEEFKNLTENDFDLMKQKIIIEGRKILNKENISKFEGVCW